MNLFKAIGTIVAALTDVITQSCSIVQDKALPAVGSAFGAVNNTALMAEEMTEQMLEEQRLEAAKSLQDMAESFDEPKATKAKPK